MNLLENKLINSLIELKQNYHVSGVKAEFEAEGARYNEVLKLREISLKAGLNLTVKIGGAEAIKDLYEAKELNCDCIVAPMIESEYAMIKFAKAISSCFENKENKKFLINIETITGFSNLKSILNSDYFKYIDGIVLGRADMVGSLNLKREDVNSEKIFEIANVLSSEMKKKNKEMIIGGAVCIDSLPFFNKIQNNHLNSYETRKVIFNSKEALKDDNSKDGIIKAIEFEILWLKNKKELFNLNLEEDKKRIIMLENMIKKFSNQNILYV